MPVQFVENELQDLIRKLNSKTSTLHPLVFALGIYLKFLLIHPFHDGNGRTARLLAQLCLARHFGIDRPLLPFGPYFASRKASLFHAYFRLELCFDPDPLIDFFADAVRDTAQAVAGLLEVTTHHVSASQGRLS
jgi:Fic family protein